MHSLKQLLRQPLRSVICIIALMLSGTILCLSIDLYYSAVMTVISVFTTVTLGNRPLESMFDFQQNKAVITNGSIFTKAEYKHGDKACINSEALALENDLHVGDAIHLAFYKGYRSFLEKSYNLRLIYIVM